MGLNEMLSIFQKESDGASKITFIGSPGLCTPFAEFLSYGVTDKETHFIPFVNVDECREFELRPYGLALKDEISNPYDSDIVVVMGGLAIPDFNVDLDELNALIEKIMKKDGKIIGVCFMNMFDESGWLKKIDFDCIIDGTLITMVKR
ncbi:DUF2124 family protein [Methanobrevibacter sp.]|uniref:DUF2124 family protein n=1 Tax=Methanobrevibacter sp. TaxID=66852 RepID=UPI0026DFC3FB|nr:DUF2124 family protein [Methanobrevibacter sp.]MDO5860285.1 DUF2124 family protein [Methanobrevibacter sp.]